MRLLHHFLHDKHDLLPYGGSLSIPLFPFVGAEGDTDCQLPIIVIIAIVIKYNNRDVVFHSQVPGRKYTYKFNLSGILQSGRKSFGGNLAQLSPPFAPLESVSPYPMQRTDLLQQTARDFNIVRQNSETWPNSGFLPPTLPNSPDLTMMY